MKVANAEFGKLKFSENEGQGTYTNYFYDVSEKDYFAYLSSLTKEGYKKVDEYEISTSKVTLYEKDGDMLLSNYYPTVHEAIIVTEPKSKYLSFSETKRGKRTTPFMAQIDLEDFGTSVVFRLFDGKFIVFDGGCEFLRDAEKLVKFLKENSPDEKPIIAAWIITHPHSDHYGCFISLSENFPDALTVERFIYNFTDTEEDDLKRIPEFQITAETTRKVEEYVRKYTSDIYKAHTGQIYNISGARLEILSSPDDTLRVPVKDVNVLSLVIKVTIEEQSILLCADADLSKCNLRGRYGNYIKSDILEPPHHMFYGGDVETYNVINPRVCVVPSFEEDALGIISPYVNSCKKENLHLFYNLSVEEFFTGSTGNVVLPLPYTPTPHGRENYQNKLAAYKKSLGAESWFFADITKEECEFTFVNATNEKAIVSVDLLTDGRTGFVYAIRLEVPEKSTKRINILDLEEVNPSALYYNPHSLSKKGIKDDATFTAHFRSSLPIVVKGKKPADYHS